ncbi:MAG TPA: peptidase S8 [Pseudonocardiaceae bacterium]|jgi:subtilase family serine protease|nr:peptidase S8 [Pseudonocardiaceae bacterium]
MKLLLAGVLVVAALVPTTTANAATPHFRDVCATAAPGQARCFAEIRTGAHPLTANGLPSGYGPADLASAYDLPSTGGAGQTVAIVDAGDDAGAEADLAVYRATYGLPPCTTANGCFRKIDQTGTASPLPQDFGWGVEISLDLDMVSAACPQCHIVLAEADDPSFVNLAAAENAAVAAGANEVSNSYGGTEQNGMQQFEAAYRHPGVAILASSGDSGYGIPNFPAVFDDVIAVGGTTLTRASNARGWTESAWIGAGSGCSAWIDKPSWQQDQNCPGRMVADIAADADPDTGVAVYDANDGIGWVVVGGTSASSPFVAGVIGLAGNPGRYGNASYFYQHASSLNDVTSGNNGFFTDCGDYQCNGTAGYDGPTGMGTPHGTAAF